MSWQLKSLGSLSILLVDGTHFSPKSTSGPHLYITSKNVGHGVLRLNDVSRISTVEHEEIYRRCPTQLGDIWLTKDGACVGNVARNEFAEPVSLLSSLAVIRPDPSRVDPDYVYQWLLSDSGQARLKGAVAGQAITRVTLQQLKGMQLPIPPRNVQKAIAKIAGIIDRHVLLIGASLGETRRLKRALLQQLLTGACRAGSSAAWKRVALTDVTQEVSSRNGDRLGPDRVMGVLKHEGLVPMRERTMADDLSRYKVVSPRAFAYNPMRINIGSIAFSWHPHDVLVSPDYEVFATRPDRLDPRYLDHLRRSEPWASFVKRAGNGSVRVRIYYQDLGQFVFPLPPLDEQQRIANLLDRLDYEITLLDRQVAAYRQLKRGLMQKLLTGEFDIPTTKGPTTRVQRHD